MVSGFGQVFASVSRDFLAASPLVGTDQENESERWLTSKEKSNKLDVFQTKYLLCMVHQADLRHFLDNLITNSLFSKHLRGFVRFRFLTAISAR